MSTPATTPTPANTAEIAYDRLGEGPPLLLLHPLGLDRGVWAPVLDLLAPHRELIVPDLPGFGGSPPLGGEGPPDPPALAAAIAGFAAGLGLDGRPHAAGNSLGGWIALELAAAKKVASVTALAPAGLWRKPLAPRRARGHLTARRLRPLLPLFFRSARVRRGTLRFGVVDPEALPPGAALAIVRSYASGTDFVAVNDAMRAGTFTAWDQIDVPVTIGWGEHDRLNPPPKRGFPDGVRAETIHGASHLPMFDAPEECARLILETSGGEASG
jgi:pimeloyl-ACP methyl ester carboxylesterase